MNRRRIDELWAGFLSGETLSAAEKEELRAAFSADAALQREFLGDERMDGQLQAIGRSQEDGETFARRFADRLAADEDGPRFARRVENRIREEFPAASGRRSRFLPVFVLVAGAAAALLLVLFLARRSGPEREPGVPSPTLVGAPDPAPPVKEKEERPVVGAPEPEPTKPVTPTPEPAVPRKEPPSKIEEAPAPAPDPVPKPPAPEPSKPEPTRRHTVAAAMTLSRVEGTVFAVAGDVRTRARQGVVLAPGQGLETVGSASRMQLTYADGTNLEMKGEGTLRDLASEEGKEKQIFLSRGTVTVAAKSPMILTTSHAAVRVEGARLAVNAGLISTSVEMFEGSALFTTLGDGKSNLLKAGQFAVAQGQVDPKQVDEAIRKGLAWLKTAGSPPATTIANTRNSDELILLTLLTGGVPDNDPTFQELFKRMIEGPIDRTYGAALQAMVLEEVHRVNYQMRIYSCAQFLVDNQCTNGQWGYAGKPPATTTPETASVPTGGSATKTPKAAGSKGPAPKVKPKVVRLLKVKKTQDGPAAGDNSNSQYGALGLRACFDAGVLAPDETITKAGDFWRKNLNIEKGPAVKNGGVATGPGMQADPRGWGYAATYGGHPQTSYGAMTVGGVGSLVIYDYLTKKDWRRDPEVQSGVAWIAQNFSATEHPQYSNAVGNTFVYYYLYGLERAGILYDTGHFGRHDWYAEGAAFLLQAQKPDGSWGGTPKTRWEPVWDTCFAILFLKRSTRALDVASTDSPKKDR